MQREYLEIAHASDIKNPKERRLYRCFEALPASLAWGTLILAFVLSWLAPIVVAIFIIIFDFFWLLRISYLSFHQISSFREMKKNLKTDWIKKLENLNPPASGKNWQDIYHLIILPMYKEGLEVVRPTFQSLAETTYPKEKMIVVLAIEERAGQIPQKVAREIEKEFGNKFFRFLVTCHPKDIPGEIAGKGSNQSWAINQAREKIINKLSIKPENIIVSGFDIDTRPYPQYFTCLTWNYLTAERPLRSSYQPIPIYNNNIWEAPAFSRVISSSGTFWQMMQQERPEQLVTYSAHSMPFKIYPDVGYPANIVSDDSHIFWKCFLYYDGDYRVVPLYYPVSMDAVSAKTFLRTAVNQYKQQRRWAWGCVEIPYLIYGFFKNKKISLKEKIRHTFIILDGFWSWSVAALLIFFLGWLPLMIGSPEFQISLLSYNLPRLTSNIMTVAMIGMITSATVSLLLLPPRPKKYSRWKNASFVLQWFLLPVTLILFGAFPAIEAQTRLMLGKYMGFWVTEKIRKS
jgi:hypothetical protein